jgi:HEAT repeat protein
MSSFPPTRWSFAVAVLIPLAAGFAAEPAPREAFDLAVELVRGSDPDLRSVALEQLRDGLVGEAYTVELAERVLPTLAPDVQPRLLAALAGRGDRAALPGIMTSLAAADPAVVAAAVRAIAPLGGGEQVPPLAARLGDEEPVAAAARAALVAIQGPEVSRRLVAVAGDASLPAASRAAVFEILARRRDRSAVAMLAKAAVADDATLRAAAMTALGKLSGPADVGRLVAGFLAAAEGGERSDAERAILAVCVQGPEAKPAAAALLDVYQAAEPGAQEKLLPLLARVGGPDVLAVVDSLVADPDPGRRRRGLTALARWPDAAVADRLLKLIGTTTDEAERELLLGGLIRIAPVPDNGLDDAHKLALVAKTLPLCTSDADRRRLIERTGAVRSVEALRFIVPFFEQPALAESAAKGVVELAHHRSLRDAHKAEFTAALDRVLAVAQDPVTRDRAERYKQGKTWERR